MIYYLLYSTLRIIKKKRSIKIKWKPVELVKTKKKVKKKKWQFLGIENRQLMKVFTIEASRLSAI